LFGRVLKITQNGFADLVASAAHLVCGEGNEGLPVVLLRGLTYESVQGKASDMVRPPEQDLYR
jgi:coenzyme F420-0:L-glutamate ligase/coenzyme F420-1:gamma-L-glutamate ligase